MQANSPNIATFNPWAHRAACGLACATFPLIWIGGLVTSYDAGMAVPDWPSTYGYNLFLYPWQIWINGPWDLFIEHGHRLWGACTGVFAILLVFIIFRGDGRRWLKGVALSCLALVIVQGILGGLRVRLNSPTLAQVHGIVGPLFFALTVAVCGFTSRWWNSSVRIDRIQPTNLDRTWVLRAWGLLAACVVQLLIGSNLRHVNGISPAAWFEISVYAHAVLGVAILIWGLNIAARTVRGGFPHGIRWVAIAIGGLVLTQVGLGVMTWMLKYGWPAGIWIQSPVPSWTVAAESATQSVVATAHIATGSLLLALAVSLGLRVQRALFTSDSTRVRSPLESREPTTTTKVWRSIEVPT